MKAPKTILYVGNYLAKTGITPTFNFQLIPRLREHFKVISTSSKEKKFLRMLDMIWELYRKRKVVNVVIIDVYSRQGYWYAVIIARLAHFYKIPYINLLHGGNLPIRLEGKAQPSKKLFGNAAYNISPSRYLQDVFIRAGFDVQCIPNFIEIEKYPYQERPHIAARLFWLRSFHEIYNPLLAVRVLKRLVEMGYEASLCMVGPDKDGTFSQVLALANELKVLDRLNLPGQLAI